MSYFQTQFQGGAVPVTDAMRTRDFIARQKEQDDQRREKSKMLAEDQKRLGMMAQGLGLEKGEVDSMSRGELQGFLNEEIRKKGVIDEMDRQEQAKLKFLSDAESQRRKDVISLINAQTAGKNAETANMGAIGKFSESQFESQRIADQNTGNANISNSVREKKDDPEFAKKYPSSTAIAREGGSDEQVAKAFLAENTSDTDAKDPINFDDLADEKLIPEVAKDYAEFMDKGGPLTATRKIRTFRNVLDKLESGEVETGQFTNLFGELVRKYVTDPEGMDAQQQVQKVIAETLKETLGAQFTEKEATQLLQRSYDPDLPSKFNIGRLKVAIQEITEQTDYRIRYFNQFAEDPKGLRKFIQDPKNSKYQPNTNNTLPSGKSYNKFKNLNLPTGVVNITPSAPAPVVNQPAPSVPSSSPGINMPPRFNNNPPLNQGALLSKFSGPQPVDIRPGFRPTPSQLNNKAVPGINQILNQTLNRNLPTR